MEKSRNFEARISKLVLTDSQNVQIIFCWSTNWLISSKQLKLQVGGQKGAMREVLMDSCWDWVQTDADDLYTQFRCAAGWNLEPEHTSNVSLDFRILVVTFDFICRKLLIRKYTQLEYRGRVTVSVRRHKLLTAVWQQCEFCNFILLVLSFTHVSVAISVSS